MVLFSYGLNKCKNISIGFQQWKTLVSAQKSLISWALVERIAEKHKESLSYASLSLTSFEQYLELYYWGLSLL